MSSECEMMDNSENPRKSTTIFVESNMRVQKVGQTPGQEINIHAVVAFLCAANN